MIDPILVNAAMTVGTIAGITTGTIAGGWLYSVYDPTKVPSIKLRTEEGEFKSVIKAPRKKYGLIVLCDGGNQKGLGEAGYTDDNTVSTRQYGK